MVNRHIYDEMIDKLKEVYSHHEGLDFEEFMRQMTEIRDNFDIKLMLVGIVVQLSRQKSKTFIMN